MNDDIFALKELREIILAFPQSTPGSREFSDTRLPSLLTTASGDALWLTDQLRKRVLDELQIARQRLVLSTLARKLDVGSKDLLSLLAEPEVRAQWCYNTGIHSIIPPAELSWLLQTLGHTCLKSFVNYQDYCQGRDINAADFRDHLRRFNESRDDYQQLGIGRWYDGSETPSKNVDFLYSASLLESTRLCIRQQLQQAAEDHGSVVLGPDTFRGLDGRSFSCLVHKVLEGLFDYNSDFIAKCTLMFENNHITFTPPTALMVEEQRRVQQLIERSNGWRSSGKPAVEHMPCLSLRPSGQRQSQSEEVFHEASEIANEIDPAEKLVKLGDYALTYRALKTLAGRVLSDIEVSPSVFLSIPKDVDPGHGDAFLSHLYNSIVTDFSADAGLIVRTGQYISLKASIAIARTAICGFIEQQAQQAWQNYAADPASFSFPDTALANALPYAATSVSPDGQTGFYEALAKLAIGAQMKKDPGQSIWRSAISTCESTYNAKFAAAYSKHVLGRLQLHVFGLQSLDASKLRTELAVLLVDYLLSSYLADTLRKMEDSTGLKTYGRQVEPAITKLESQLKSHGERSQDPEEDIEKISQLLQACGTGFKSHKPGTDQLTGVKAELEAEASASASNRKGDKDGSRAFLCIVLLLWSRNNVGFLYATGRFVPRLLKLLKGKISDAQNESLQQLKDVVKSGSMSGEERNELIGLAAEKDRD